jgi:hypothetical protein
MRPGYLVWPVLLGVLLSPLRLSTAAETVGPDEVIRRAEERFRTLNDYDCLADTDTRAGKKSASGTYHLWFKKPEMVRIRVIRGGHRGSEVAIDANGKVRGREGGLLKPFVVGLSKTDRRLRSIRGVPITELDWGSFYKTYHERAARAGAHTTLAPRASDEAPYLVTVTYTDKGLRMRETFRIDPMRWIMLEGEVFEEDVRVDHIVFREAHLDVGTSERFFRL